jgi:mono/diheme cytochrome c family protein
MKQIVAGLFLVAFASTALAADGAEVFKKKCQICHGPEAKGAKIVTRAVAGTPEAKVLEMVKKGGGKMKPVSLSDEDAAAVAKYVSGLK